MANTWLLDVASLDRANDVAPLAGVRCAPAMQLPNVLFAEFCCVIRKLPDRLTWGKTFGRLFF